MDKALIAIGEKIKEYVSNGGSLSDKNLPFDRDIKMYVSNNNKLKRKLIEKDPNNPICTKIFSKDEVLKELGYEPVVKHKALNFERVYNEIFDYLNNGGKLNKVNAKEYPFWETIRKFQEKENKKGIKISFNEILSKCGLFESEFIEINNLLNSYADENGCIDSIRKTRDYNTIRSKATTFGCSPSEYVTLFSQYHFSKAVLPVTNYIETLKNDISNFLKGKNDATGIRESNFSLYLRVKHLKEYFPEGSLDSIEETFNALGFNYEGVVKPKTRINEKYFLSKLEAEFPNKIINKIDYKSILGKNLLRLSLQNNMFIYDYLKTKGFEYVQAKNSNRLTQTNAPDKLVVLRRILVNKAIEYNQEKMNLKYECHKRVLKNGKELICGKVLKEGQVIYMPHTLELDNSKKEVATMALNEFREKNM